MSHKPELRKLRSFWNSLLNLKGQRAMLAAKARRGFVSSGNNEKPVSSGNMREILDSEFPAKPARAVCKVIFDVMNSANPTDP
jgi:hypothetical protein